MMARHHGNYKCLQSASLTPAAESLETQGEEFLSLRRLGLDGVVDLCDRLLAGGAPGLHFYTMNQAGPSATIWQRLGL